MRAPDPLRLTDALAGRYNIEREIGAGGMATVYLARDLKHDRRVALKVLKPELGAVLGVERFLAEIKVTANLQHPNLLPLFDSGEANGLLFYTMPYVEGESLRDRLQRERQLPIDEAIRIAVAVANALDYAHQQGVIHRDLKPENLLFEAGEPVLADFGIARAVSRAGGHRITQTGLSLGTPQYMSPEQATGDRVIDGRSDIYSLAAVTYEMLTGEPPHTGSTAQAIFARVLIDKPRSIRIMRAAVPIYVDAALEHALEKLPADRFSTAHEFAKALQGREGMVTPDSTAPAPATATGHWRVRFSDPFVLTLGAISLAAIAIAIALARRTPAAAPMTPIRFVIAASDSAAPYDLSPWPAAISPDGRTVVYPVAQKSGGSLLYAHRTDQLDAHPIPGTNGAFQPLFSPDGAWVEFESGGKARKARLDGGAPITISNGSGGNGADWTTSDEIVLGGQGTFHGLARVSAAGGEAVEFTHPDAFTGETDHMWPIALADGKTVVFTVWSGVLAESRLAITSLRDGKVTGLGIKGIRPLAFLEGALVYVQADGAVMAIPLDIGARRTTGKPVPVLDPVNVSSLSNGNSGIFVSRGGALVTSHGSNRSQLTWVNRDGTARIISREIRGFSHPRLSPDGRRIAVVAGDSRKTDIWIFDSDNGTFSRLSSAEFAKEPEWTADGKRVVYVAMTSDGTSAIWAQLAAGGSPPEKLVDLADLPGDAVISPDGRSLLFSDYRNNSWDIFRVALDSSPVARPYLATKATEFAPRFSPDGRWVALASDESGRSEIYVRSFPDPRARVQISTDGGMEPVWSGDGNRVYYRSGARLMAAKLAISSEVRILSRDTVLTQTDAFSQAAELCANYDVQRDGSRILTLSSSRQEFGLVVVPSWLAEFRQRLSGTSAKK